MGNTAMVYCTYKLLFVVVIVTTTIILSMNALKCVTLAATYMIHS